MEPKNDPEIFYLAFCQFFFIQFGIIEDHEYSQTFLIGFTLQFLSLPPNKTK